MLVSSLCHKLIIFAKDLLQTFDFSEYPPEILFQKRKYEKFIKLILLGKNLPFLKFHQFLLHRNFSNTL